MRGARPDAHAPRVMPSFFIGDSSVVGFIPACTNASCNLLHELPPFHAFRLMTSNTTNLDASTPLQECGKSLHIPLEPPALPPLCSGQVCG